MSVTDEDLAALEAKLGARLPAMLRAHLRTKNGCWIERTDGSWRVFPVQSGSSKDELSRTACDIAYETRSARDFHDLPEGWIAIAVEADARRWWVVRAEGGVMSNEVHEWTRELDEPRPLDHLAELLDGAR